ncbi:MAG: translocation/assembly module TamB domain-containing protein [Bryobacteraceae bacterium]
MTRPWRVLRNAAIALGALIVVLAIAVIWIARSEWFQNYLKQTIVASVEESAGGRVEIGSFRFEWNGLSALATDFVIHGTEPQGTAPMLRVARVRLNLRFLPNLHHWWDITYLGVDRPQANVIVYPDGHTNIPSPRLKSTSSNPLETVVDLAIGRFELTAGAIALGAQKHELNVRGNNLRAQLSYNTLSQEYRGQMSLQPVYVISGQNTPVNFTVNLPVVISRNRIDLNNASIFSPNSSIALDASITDLKNPKLAAHATGHIALADLKSFANLPAETIDLDANVNIDPQGAYSIDGNLKNFALQFPPYRAIVSGPIHVTGSLQTGFPSLAAQARLSIAPARRGIPVSGNVTAEYSGARNVISIQKSLLILPHSRLTVDGSIGEQLNVVLTTTNLIDLPVPSSDIALHDPATFRGKVTGSLTAPKISGHVTASRFSVADRRFDSFDADASVTKSSVAIENADLSRNRMQAHFSGTLGLSDWKPRPSAPLAVTGSIQSGDLADLLALAGQPSSAYSGELSANLRVNGTLGNPRGAASLVVTDGMVQGQPFDRAEGQVDLTDQLVTVRSAFVQLGPARVNITGEFRHPRDSFTTGQFQASIQSDQINLGQVNAVRKQQPNTAGVVQLNADITGNVSGKIQLTSVNGKASVRGLEWQGRNYGDLTAQATTSGQAVNYNLISNFAGSHIDIHGSTQLTPDYPTSANATLGDLPLERLLAIVDRTDIPVKGILSGTANFSGTIANPQGSADLALANATIYGDAVNRVHARLNYQPQSIDVPQLELVSGAARLDLTAHYDHAVGNLEAGNLQFHLDSSSIDLARIKTLAEKRPGLTGTLQLNASGSAQVRAAEPRILLRDVSGNLKTTNLAIKGKNLGDLTVAASTSGGRTNFTIHSAIAGAAIEGHGSVQLANDYPADAQLTFKNVTWAGLQPLLGYSSNEGGGFEAAADGQVSLSGPLMNTQQLGGSIQVTRLEAGGTPSFFRRASPMLLQNQGPIAATLERGTLKIQSAHLTGSQTDLQVTGTVPLNGQAMNIALNGNVNLAVLQQFDRDITSSGSVVLTASVRGSTDQPRLSGQVELHNASFDYTGLPAGLWRANGVIALNGNSAVIRNLTAEAGGGQVAVTGSATLSDTLRFGLQTKATRVRLMVQGVGVVASASVNLAGTTDNSSISGTVTVEEISYASRTDLGSMLSLAAPPVQAPSAPSQIFENMRLDIRVRSSNSLGVQSSLAQNVQLTADLRVRGSVAHPGVLGRVQITEGKLLFFGSTYTMNSGNISFYNPIRIEPILDLSLETQAQGVDVVLKVTGPIDNMKLSYTSDPPLQFQQIVNLLATGATPTTDPTLLANQPALPAQSFQQLGESAIVGQALANPVANQLQRVFGVTQLRINPTFATGSQLPETQLSLQQQISNNLTFTYVTGLNTANAETIQVVWTFTPQWSAQALRDYNGIFSVTLIYKRQFR